MKNGKTFFGRVLASIFGWLLPALKGAEQSFDKMPLELQNALLYGTGVVNTINEHLDKEPQFVKDLIQKIFPDFDEAHLEASLKTAGGEMAAVAEELKGADALQAIAIIQKHLASLKIAKGGAWAKASSFLSQAIAFFTAPPETKFKMITTVIESVYQKYFKKKA